VKNTSVAPFAAVRSAAVADSSSRILIVDSDESSRSVLGVALAREGFDAVGVSSSNEALRLLGPNSPLPAMLVVGSEVREEDGFSFVAQLRGDRRTSLMPVLLLAKNGQANLHELSRMVGVDEILLKPAFARDIVTLARLQLAPAKDNARVLSTEKVPVAHVLRALLATSRSGVIEVEKGRGKIAFRRGQVLDANFDNLHGLNGLVRSLALARGDYRVITRSLAFDAAFHFTIKEMVTVVFPRLERWEELLARSLPLDARLAVDFPALARALPSMPDSVNGVVRLFDGVRDVRQVLMDSPLDETVSAEVATRLYLMGVVAAIPGREQAPVAKADPHLFEPKPTEAVERMDALFAANPAPIQVLAETEGVEEDWFRAAQGSGLEVADPSEGWSTTRPADLSADLAQQLTAFNIQPVIDVQTAPKVARDLQQFSAGESPAEQPMETALTSPIPLIELAGPRVSIIEQSARALEDEFFRIEETPATDSPQLSVSEAVLGLSTEEQSAAIEPTRISRVGWLAIAALLVAATAATAWRFSESGIELGSAAPPNIEVVDAPPAAAEVKPLEPLMQAPIPEPVIASSALIDATRLYDTGKIAEAARALEQLVTEDPSSTQAWLMLGLARYDIGNPAGAEEAANTVLALDPKAARAHLLLATIQIDSGHRPQANDEIQKYLEIEPAGPFADEAKALLKR
jgi:DNA-binding response OmpR family regulator